MVARRKDAGLLRERNGQFGIYTIPAAGGDEARLTTAKGMDDGPEYSPDGKYIYFNSDRTGPMQIWRMRADGSEPGADHQRRVQQLVPPRLARRQLVVFFSYEKDVKGHPENKDVTLRIMDLHHAPDGCPGDAIRGQGTINVASWSPNSHTGRLVSYQIIPR